jgi:hypothetical protein
MFVDSGGFHDYKIVYIASVTILISCLSANLGQLISLADPLGLHQGVGSQRRWLEGRNELGLPPFGFPPE